MGIPMGIKLLLSFLWIPPDLGGHSDPPYEGMRLQIRWQRHIEEHLKYSRDVQCDVLDFDPQTSRGKLLATPISIVPPEWLREGELVELVNGSRVLAIGKIEGHQESAIQPDV